MLRLPLLTLFCGIILAAVPQPALNGAEFSFGEAPKWADFGVGSWKLVRIYKETLNDEGQVESIGIDETKSTLVDIDEHSCTIRAETTVEVRGRRFTAEPKLFTRKWNSHAEDGRVDIQEAGERDVRVAGRVYPTEVRDVLVQEKDARIQSTVYHSPTVYPYVLRMETEGKDTAGERTLFNSIAEVVTVDMPHRVLSEIKTAAHVRITDRVHTSGEERITIEVQCRAVPGWVVAHSSKLLSEKRGGQVVQRTTLELLDYEALPKE